MGPGDSSPAISPRHGPRATKACRDGRQACPVGTLPWHPLFLPHRTRWSARPPAPPRLPGALRAARPSRTWLEALRTRPSLTTRLHAPLSGSVLRRLMSAYVTWVYVAWTSEGQTRGLPLQLLHGQVQKAHCARAAGSWFSGGRYNTRFLWTRESSDGDAEDPLCPTARGLLSQRPSSPGEGAHRAGDARAGAASAGAQTPSLQASQRRGEPRPGFPTVSSGP